jgi:hypothetical protein
LARGGRRTSGGRLARLAKGRGPVAVGGGGPKMRGKESGPAGVEEEVGHGWAEYVAGPKFKRNYFRISIDFRIW